MKKHRFQLRKYFTGCKVRCPDCGRKSFNLFIDILKEVQFPEDVGWCDHPSCHTQHDHSPAKYFRDHPEKRPKGYADNWTKPFSSLSLQKNQPIMTEQPKPLMFMPRDFMEQTLHHYHTDRLFGILTELFGEDKVKEVYDRYGVGGAKYGSGSVVFWQQDINGNIRTGKIMRYGDDAHKTELPHGGVVNWAHCMWRQKPKRFQMTQCFFGEHLLTKSSNQTVMLVESEKSAIVGTLFIPRFLWLASGGNNGCLNPEASKVLIGRKVILVPDLNMEKKWAEKLEMLRGLGVDAEMFDMSQLNPTPEDIEKGLDLADFLLCAEPSDKEKMYREFEKIKARWRQENPEFYRNFMNFYTTFDCELTAIEPMTNAELAKYGKPRKEDP